jgi:2'-5' RNA ligase
MKLLAIAYPELLLPDLERIQNYRKNYDLPFYNIVNPHFTLVFPVAEFPAKDFLAEIKKQLAGASSIRFVIRCASIHKDAFNERYHTFLVPDEGYTQLVKLHDRLYTGKLSKELRSDLDYIPHITIASLTDKFVCEKIAVEWNAVDFEISGKISSVDIIEYENEIITTIEKIKLSESE